MQAAPLSVKISLTKQRIRDWVNEYGEDGVYVSFSGGKDSTVLLTIAREEFPGIKAAFCDTGLEFPEIREFVKTFENVDWLKPAMSFRQVIEKYGYPIISKEVAQCVYEVRRQAELRNIDKRETSRWERSFNPNGECAKKYPLYSRAKYDFLNDAPFWVSHHCCNVMKKKPAKLYEKHTGRKPILATMAVESRLRKTSWLRHGCNAFDSERPTSTPMAFWMENDVLQYIKRNNIPICSVYGEIVSADDTIGQLELDVVSGADDTQKLKTTGYKRTGCMFCMFGCAASSWDNFERMKQTHPKQYDYIMRPKENGGLDCKRIIDWVNEHGGMHIRY